MRIILQALTALSGGRGSRPALCVAAAAFIWAAATPALAERIVPPLGGKPPAAQGHLLVLGFAGDLGFSGADQPLNSSGAIRHGDVIPWAELMRGVSPLLKADANFANLETVITDRSDLTPIDKAFNFAASPAGLGAAASVGIDVLTAANNHAADFGGTGITETLRHLEALKARGLLTYAGLGIGPRRYEPGTFMRRGSKIGFAAIGRGINHDGPDGPGQPLYASPADFERVTRGLGGSDADVKVLSVHYGEELNLIPADADRARLRSAADSGRADIVFGHHSHVASGVERRGDAVIFYGLGNFMHAGTQDMSRYDLCRDFGLYARVYLWSSPGVKPFIRAIEIFPLRGMNRAPEPYPPAEAAVRVALVNAMSEAIAGEGGGAVHFNPTASGSGLACMPDGSDYGDELSARCRVAGTMTVRMADTGPGVSLAACRPPPQAEARRQPAPPPPPIPRLRATGQAVAKKPLRLSMSE